MSIADELITRGWYQGSLIGPDDSVCLMGALAMDCGYRQDSRDLSDTWDGARFTLGHRLIEGLVGGVKTFNDAPDRTFDEVLRVAKEVDAILDQ